jgi:excisionase family DNA binding protein
MQQIEQQTVNVNDLAKILGVGRDFARSLVTAGKLPNVGNAKRIRIPKDAINNYLTGRK